MKGPFIIKVINKREGCASIDILVFGEGTKGLVVFVRLIGDPFAGRPISFDFKREGDGVGGITKVIAELELGKVDVVFRDDRNPSQVEVVIGSFKVKPPGHFMEEIFHCFKGDIVAKTSLKGKTVGAEPETLNRGDMKIGINVGITTENIDEMLPPWKGNFIVKGMGLESLKVRRSCKLIG